MLEKRKAARQKTSSEAPLRANCAWLGLLHLWSPLLDEVSGAAKFGRPITTQFALKLRVVCVPLTAPVVLTVTLPTAVAVLVPGL